MRDLNQSDSRDRKTPPEGEEAATRLPSTCDVSRSCNQITDSSDYIEIEMEDELATSHRKGILDPAFDRNPAEDGAEGMSASEKRTAAAAQTSRVNFASSSGSSSSRRHGVTEDQEEDLADGLTLPAKDQSARRSQQQQQQAQTGSLRASLPSPATSPSASSALLLLSPRQEAVRSRNQSNLGNNLLQQQRQSKRSAASGAAVASGARESADPARDADIEARKDSSATRVSRSNLRVEHESSCGSSMPASTGTNTGSASVAQVWEEKQRISLSRERKAARVLGIVMGTCPLHSLSSFTLSLDLVI